MNEREIRAVLERSALASDTGTVLAAALPALSLRTAAVAADHLTPGASRIGGLPDLPLDTGWPIDDGRPLDFIAQIDLAEAAASGRLPGLPAAGWLAFFYDAYYQPWGFDPADAGGWRVLFFEGEAASLDRKLPPQPVAPTRPAYRGFLARLLRLKPKPRKAPPALRPFNALALRFEPTTSLPNLLDLLDIDHKDRPRWDAWEDFEEAYWAQATQPGHQLGGYPDEIQGEMTLECQLASNGVYCGNPKGYEDERVETLAPGAKDWRLLLQIDSDDNAGWMWGDVGCIYFWIRRQDLEARNFDRVWCVLQCG